ncbi:CPBP family intramembrane glutamic endopeptidase [Pseudonocardia lacus]|uniref:CPBP family intramembrane glutamic endopeptidase n=1 Tax=Pseudonocardia lacus TaxID=2835865 RepID=UPI001BDD5F85|nr:CPBP family intramembrane glutamic endopeptidase [Pseudonocardia lacus]
MSSSDVQLPPRAAGSGRGGGLLAYLVLAYGLTWAWLAPVWISGGVVSPGDGWPTHFPALLGPMVAALLVAARAGELRGLVARMVRVRVPARWWLVAVSPLGMLLVGLLVASVTGAPLPAVADFGVMSGLPAAWGPLLVGLVVVVVNGVGEETGWRGFALPALQRRLAPLAAMLVLAVLWAGWHVPMFGLLTSFREFDAATVVGWLLGLTAGSIVLGWLVNRSGSVALVALWHGLFTIASGTAAGTGTVAAVVSALVMLWAAVLVLLELRAHRHGTASVLGPPPR